MKSKFFISIIKDLIFIVSVLNYKRPTAKEKKTIDFLLKDLAEKIAKYEKTRI